MREKTVQHNLLKKQNKESMDDRRGKTAAVNKIADDENDDIREHILSFPRVESHYCRSSSSKEYLPADLNVNKMHTLYVQQCKVSRTDSKITCSILAGT